jgi:hypothetical protein
LERKPRYFFHVVDGQFLVDNEGTECAGLSEVRSQAIHTAGTILRDLGGKLAIGPEWQMHVTDAAKKTVFKLRFSAEEPA